MIVKTLVPRTFGKSKKLVASTKVDDREELGFENLLLFL